jgi:ABC-type nitrate/sulfonate/bicarbonate transport system substrate-binding protein
MRTLAVLGFCLAVVTGSIAGSSAAAWAEPVTIRVGRGGAAEEQLWLMVAKPEIAPNQGKAYKLNLVSFPATDKRFLAFEAGELDLATGSANSVILVSSAGAQMTAIASISQESQKGFVTQYMVKKESSIKSIGDLKGKTIGVNGLNSSIHLWAILALQKAGLSAKDVTFVPMPFSAQGEALRAGKIDVGAFPQPFAKMQQDKGEARTLFTSKEAVPFDEELILLVAKPDFLKKNGDAVKAFLSDLVAATKYYEDNPKVARQALIDAKFVRLPASVYFDMKDYYRAPSARVDLDALNKMQELQMKAGWQEKAANIDQLVDLSYLPK